jgi:hypothetical protein
MNWAYWLTLLLAIRIYFWWQKKKARPQAAGRRLQATG